MNQSNGVKQFNLETQAWEGVEEAKTLNALVICNQSIAIQRRRQVFG
jgi:hypothetical protein